MWLSRRLGWLLYQLVIAAGMLVAAPFLFARRGSHYMATLAGRLGLHRGTGLPGALWIHAVSVGEVAVAATLARDFPATLPLVVTTVTPTGQERARALFADPGGRRVVTYLPFDLGFAVSIFFRRFSPVALILIEGDYWPLVLEAARRRKLPVVVVNGRVGEHSGRRLRRFPRLARRLFFEAVACFAVQTGEDRRRLIAAGAPAERIRVTGNLKFDAPRPPPVPALEAEARRLAAGRPILLAGSTMAGEEEQILDAFERIGAGKRALLLLAPRHPERFASVAGLVSERGLACLRRSRLEVASPGTASPGTASPGTASPGTDPPGTDLPTAGDVLLLDSLGELASLYRVADVAFIGGTLVATGGHNPLEPACFAVATIVGPSMENFRQIAARFDHADAWCRVADSAGLAARWLAWLADPQAARAVGRRAADLLAANRGALDRTLEIVQPLLPDQISSTVIQ